VAAGEQADGELLDDQILADDDLSELRAEGLVGLAEFIDGGYIVGRKLAGVGSRWIPWYAAGSEAKSPLFCPEGISADSPKISRAGSGRPRDRIADADGQASRRPPKFTAIPKVWKFSISGLPARIVC
jgi:hypothetical protein